MTNSPTTEFEHEIVDARSADGQERLLTVWYAIRQSVRWQQFLECLDPAYYGFKEWIDRLKSSGTHVWLFSFNKQPAMMFYVENRRPHRAEIHFTGLDTRGLDTVDLGVQAIDLIMEHYNLRVVYGFINAERKPLADYVRSVGWEICGIVPYGAFIHSEQRHVGALLVARWR